MPAFSGNTCAVAVLFVAVVSVPGRLGASSDLIARASVSDVSYCRDPDASRYVLEARLEVTLSTSGTDPVGVAAGHQYVAHFVAHYQRADGEPGYLEASYTRMGFPDGGLRFAKSDIVRLDRGRAYKFALQVSIPVSVNDDDYTIPNGVTFDGIWTIGLFDRGPGDLKKARDVVPGLSLATGAVKTEPLSVLVSMPETLQPCVGLYPEGGGR